MLLKPIKPNAGTGANYEKRLTALVKEMADSVLYWTRAKYRAEMALDASPAEELRAAIQRLRKRWTRKFNELAPKLAGAFVRSATGGVDRDFMRLLRDHGFTVRPTMSRGVADVVQAKIVENVSLIKSIPEQYFTAIEGHVMRSVQAGRDIAALTRELESSYGVTRRRAALIARDQNNKASAAMQTARQIEMGFYEATWYHSGGGRHPRPSHVAFNGKTFDVREGALIDGERIQPGEKINCKCYRRIKLPSLQTPK